LSGGGRGDEEGGGKTKSKKASFTLGVKVPTGGEKSRWGEEKNGSPSLFSLKEEDVFRRGGGNDEEYSRVSVKGKKKRGFFSFFEEGWGKKAK